MRGFAALLGVFAGLMLGAFSWIALGTDALQAVFLLAALPIPAALIAFAARSWRDDGPFTWAYDRGSGVLADLERRMAEAFDRTRFRETPEGFSVVLEGPASVWGHWIGAIVGSALGVCLSALPFLEPIEIVGVVGLMAIAGSVYGALGWLGRATRSRTVELTGRVLRVDGVSHVLNHPLEDCRMEPLQEEVELVVRTEDGEARVRGTGPQIRWIAERVHRVPARTGSEGDVPQRLAGLRADREGR